MLQAITFIVFALGVFSERVEIGNEYYHWLLHILLKLLLLFIEPGDGLEREAGELGVYGFELLHQEWQILVRLRAQQETMT